MCLSRLEIAVTGLRFPAQGLIYSAETVVSFGSASKVDQRGMSFRVVSWILPAL